MTNGDMIRQCTNEQLVSVLLNYKTYALYSGGENNRLLNSESPEDLLLWINKEQDGVDKDSIFRF